MSASSDAWRRRFPTAALLDVADAVADLVADRVVERMPAPSPVVERAGFSPREAGEYLGLAESTVRDHIAAGRIPAVHVGGRIVVSRKALDALLDGRAAS